MSASFNVLRDTGGPAGTTAYWKFSLGSLWDNGTYTPPGGTALDTAYAANQDFDVVGEPFRQTLGFVNREYGKPVRSDSPRVQSLGTGTPDEVYLTAVPWLDREFQSPLELINVPAVSRTGLLPQFSPGTMLQDMATARDPDSLRSFAGLPGELRQLSRRRTNHRSMILGQRHVDNADDLTGDRAGLEQIFDFVDIGPVWFDSRRWLEPNQVSFLQDDPMNPLGLRDRMFNRVVETLQPPFNFIDKHRTPGTRELEHDARLHSSRTILRTAFPAADKRWRPESGGPLSGCRRGARDADGHQPNTNPPTNIGRVFNNLNNSTNNGNGFSSQFRSSALYGNGSVYRSLTWGISTAYELDDEARSPTAMGDFNDYERTVDTRFGRSFKAFIESRRGYATQHAVPSWFSLALYLGNPMLDWRYPTQFAGVFAPAQASSVPSVQRFMRTESKKSNLTGVRRRTHDMSLLRPHPDFDLRTMTDAERSNLAMTNDASYSLRVESPTDPNGVFASQTPPSTLTIPAPEVRRRRLLACEYRWSIRGCSSGRRLNCTRTSAIWIAIRISDSRMRHG